MANKRMAAVLRRTPLALAALLAASPGQAADWVFTPIVTLRETYSDNLGSQPDPLAQGGFVTDTAAGLSVVHDSRRLKLNASAEVRRYFYQKDDIPNLRNGDRRYSAGARSMLVDDLLYLDASASGSRQLVSPFGPLTTNTYSAANSTDVRSWSISPYLVYRFGTFASMTARIARDSVTSGLRGTFGDTLSTTRSLDLANGPRYTDFGWGLSYTHQDLESNLSGDVMTENTLLSLRRRITRQLALTSTLGYDKYEYPAINQRTGGPGYTAGFIWTPSSRTSVDLSLGHRFFGKTGSLNASHRTRNSTWSLTYSDGVTTTRSQFLLPATVDTAGLLDRLFATSYPDPVERGAAVRDYIAATGLPPSLANNLNYLTNRFVRNKRLQGTVVMRGARSSLSMSIFKDQRQALSLQESDSPLLGSQQSNLYDNTRQRGANVNATYRLSSVTGAHASVYLVNVVSLDTNQTNNVKQANLGLSHQLNKKAIASLDLRHSTGRAGIFNNDKYHENAVVASLSIRY